MEVVIVFEFFRGRQVEIVVKELSVAAKNDRVVPFQEPL